MMNEQIMEEVSEFKYLCSVLCKYGSMEGKIRERALQGRKVVGSLGRMMRERTVSMEVKKALRDSIIVPTEHMQVRPGRGINVRGLTFKQLK